MNEPIYENEWNRFIGQDLASILKGSVMKILGPYFYDEGLDIIINMIRKGVQGDLGSDAI